MARSLRYQIKASPCRRLLGPLFDVHARCLRRQPQIRLCWFAEWEHEHGESKKRTGYSGIRRQYQLACSNARTLPDAEEPLLPVQACCLFAALALERVVIPARLPSVGDLALVVARATVMVIFAVRADTSAPRARAAEASWPPAAARAFANASLQTRARRTGKRSSKA